MKLLLEKLGLPQEGDFLLCKVTKIHFHSIFVHILEYGKLQGMIHISEVSPGRIRNIRDYVKEGKTVVCKVIRINRERSHVDLSLRRVTDSQRRIKVNQIKQEQVAEKIIEYVAKDEKKTLAPFFAEIHKQITEHYEFLFDAFSDVVESNAKIESLGVAKPIAAKLEVVIRQRIKPVIVEIKGKFKISSFAPDGVEQIKKVFAKAEKVKGDHRLTYKGGGVYDVLVKDKNYKNAEKVLSELTDTVVNPFAKLDATAEFIRA